MTIQLSPEDLREFHFRRNTLNNAQFHFAMIEEAYLMWVKNLQTKYQIPVNQFEIHPQTGIVTIKEE